MAKRILLLGPHLPYSGGSAHSCKELAEGLRKRGNLVIHAAPYHESVDKDLYPDVRWLLAPFHSDNIKIENKWVQEINEQLRALYEEYEGFNHVILGRESFLWNVLGIRTFFNGPISLICRGAYINKLARAGIGTDDLISMLAPMYMKCDNIICIAKHLVDSVRSILDHERVFYSPNPIILPVYNDGKNGGTDNSKIRRLVMACQLKGRKRPLDAIDAVRALNKNGLRVTLDIFGEGPQRKEIQERIDQRSLNDQIVLKGLVSRDTLLKNLKNYDIMLLCSEDEGLPRVIQEAISENLGVAAYACKGTKEACEGWPYARLADVGDIDGIAKAVQDIVSLGQREALCNDHISISRREEAIISFENLLNNTCSENILALE